MFYLGEPRLLLLLDKFLLGRQGMTVSFEIYRHAIINNNTEVKIKVLFQRFDPKKIIDLSMKDEPQIGYNIVIQRTILYIIVEMGKRKVAKKFAAVKRMISTQDHRIKTNKAKEEQHDRKRRQAMAKQAPQGVEVKQIPKEPSCLFFTQNNALGPPYRLLIDTNFINFSIQNRLDIFKASMDCLLGKCIPYISDCVIGELQKFGVRYRLALKISKDPRFERLKCQHKGTYADDCIVERVRQHRCFIVATCDKDLKRRIRKIPGVPIMYIQSHKYTIERMAEAYGAPR